MIQILSPLAIDTFFLSACLAAIITTQPAAVLVALAFGLSDGLASLLSPFVWAPWLTLLAMAIAGVLSGIGRATAFYVTAFAMMGCIDNLETGNPADALSDGLQSFALAIAGIAVGHMMIALWRNLRSGARA